LRFFAANLPWHFPRVRHLLWSNNRLKAGEPIAFIRAHPRHPRKRSNYACRVIWLSRRSNAATQKAVFGDPGRTLSPCRILPAGRRADQRRPYILPPASRRHYRAERHG
jgi:hypothetical protein